MATIISDKHYFFNENELIAERWRLVRPLGRGNFGEVWLCIDEQDHNQEQIIKLLSPISPDGDEHAEKRFAKFQRYFVREIEILKNLNHDNLVEHRGNGLLYSDGVLDSADSIYCLVTRYYRNMHDMDDRAYVEQNLSLGQRVNILQQVARALDYMHREGYIHRDIKPDNIIANREADAYLMDLGISRPVGDEDEEDEAENVFSKHVLTRLGGGREIGTPGYMSPARPYNTSATKTDDLYAFIITAFELLTGQHPFAQHGYDNSALYPIMQKFTAENRGWDKAPSELIGRKLDQQHLAELDNLFADAFTELKGVDADGHPQRVLDPRFLNATSFCDELARIIPASSDSEQPPIAPVSESRIGSAVDTIRRSRVMGAPATTWFAVIGALVVLSGIGLFSRNGNAPDLTPTLEATLTQETSVAIVSLPETAVPTTTIHPGTATREAFINLTLTAVGWTDTPTPTALPTDTPTPSATPSPTNTPTPTLTSTYTLTPTATFTQTPNATSTQAAIDLGATQTQVVNAQATVSANGTQSVLDLATQQAGATQTSMMAQTEAARPTPTPTITPTATSEFRDLDSVIVALNNLGTLAGFNCRRFVGAYNTIRDSRDTEPQDLAFELLWELIDLQDAGNIYEECNKAENRISDKVILSTARFSRNFDRLESLITKITPLSP